MRDDLLKDVLDALRPYDFRQRGEWLREGRCPDCAKRSVWTRADKPWVLRCERANRCGWEGHAKELFPDLFANWSERYRQTEESPNAAADAYLHHARGLKITGLRGAYTQEQFFSRELGEGSATVRFQLPGGAWWERLIDRPWRFGDMKARFAKGVPFGGEAWTHPADTIEAFAKAEEIWIPEGIFDALSLREGADLMSAAAMSTTNYPEKFLALVAAACRDLGVERPVLIWAFDADRAGRNATRKFVERSRADGWQAGAAQIPQIDGKKSDWNDQHLRDKLQAADLAEYLWRGDLLLATSATEKAYLLYQRAERPTFPFDFERRLWWGSVDPAKLAEAIETLQKQGLDPDDLKEKAVRQTLKVSSIANCNPQPLYFQRDPLTDESWYFYRVELAHTDKPVKNIFAPAQLASAAEFNKRLLAVSPLAMFTGNQQQLIRVLDQHKRGLRTVEALGFVGYSREHQAYVFNDLAVKGGKVFKLNEDDFFDLGKVSVKSVDRSVGLEIVPWDDRPDFAWLDDLWTAFGAQGLVALTYWFGSLYAEQLRQRYKSFPFLELSGEPNSGKTTLIEFLWKLCGRLNYEGFDPSKSTPSARSRNFAQVGNLPVVLIEGDRDDDTGRSKKFDFDELKSLYNGRSVRSRGVKNNGNETYEPPFRGSVVIEQNRPVEASDAILQRICHLWFDGEGYNAQTKLAADRLETAPIDALSGFIVAAAKAEADVLAYVEANFPAWEQGLMKTPTIAHRRIAKCHAQMLTLLEAMARVIPISDERIAATRQQLQTMAAQRKLAIAADDPTVEAFWEAYDWVGVREVDQYTSDNRLNHSHSPDEIAVNLSHFAQVCTGAKIPFPEVSLLKRHLRSSKSRQFLRTGDVKSRIEGKSMHCWIFAKAGAPKARKD